MIFLHQSSPAVSPTRDWCMIIMKISEGIDVKITCSYHELTTVYHVISWNHERKFSPIVRYFGSTTKLQFCKAVVGKFNYEWRFIILNRFKYFLRIFIIFLLIFVTNYFLILVIYINFWTFWSFINFFINFFGFYWLFYFFINFF